VADVSNRREVPPSACFGREFAEIDMDAAPKYRARGTLLRPEESSRVSSIVRARKPEGERFYFARIILLQGIHEASDGAV
jgi:hypothetical protein